MPTPTFNGSPLFNSETIYGSVTEGVCWTCDYTKIFQVIHFEGEVGDWCLDHGYPDRPWYFEGIVASLSASGLNSILQGIESQIDNATGGTGGSGTLTDSLGNSFQSAQVRRLSKITPPQVTAEGGYMMRIRVEGIIQSANTKDGE